MCARRKREREERPRLLKGVREREGFVYATSPFSCVSRFLLHLHDIMREKHETGKQSKYLTRPLRNPADIGFLLNVADLPVA